MKMIRRFFAYVISIILVIVLAYGYVYWDDLFGENTPIGYLLNSSTEKSRLPVIQEPIDDVESSAVDVVDTETVIDESAVIEAEPIQDQENIITDVVPTESPLSTNDSVNENKPVVIDENLLTELSIPELWILARESFDYRDYATSVASYQQLIARTQNNFDAYEELGDVHEYYGNKPAAAEAYFSAAVILVRMEKIEHAANLMSPLILMDQVKARALLDLITASTK